MNKCFIGKEEFIFSVRMVKRSSMLCAIWVLFSFCSSTFAALVDSSLPGEMLQKLNGVEFISGDPTWKINSKEVGGGVLATGGSAFLQFRLSQEPSDSLENIANTIRDYFCATYALGKGVEKWGSGVVSGKNGQSKEVSFYRAGFVAETQDQVNLNFVVYVVSLESGSVGIILSFQQVGKIPSFQKPGA